MKGYVARKGNRWYAVIYEGTDPITGRERSSGGCGRRVTWRGRPWHWRRSCS